MWHEQRKEERRIRGMLVDRRRRAERRRDYYERIKADPNQFLQASNLIITLLPRITGYRLLLLVYCVVFLYFNTRLSMFRFTGDQ